MAKAKLATRVSFDVNHICISHRWLDRIEVGIRFALKVKFQSDSGAKGCVCQLTMCWTERLYAVQIGAKGCDQVVDARQ